PFNVVKGDNRFYFCLSKLASQDFRKPLREDGAREHVVNACFGGTPLKLGLHVREEGDDWDAAQLFIGFESGGEREGVYLRRVQVEDDERRHFDLGGVEERVR